MNLSDIKDRIFRMTNHTYSDTFHMRDLINSALTILSDEAKLEGVQTYNINSDNLTQPLPTGYKANRAMVEGSLDNPIATYNLLPLDQYGEGYSVVGGDIVFKGISGDRTLNFYYYKYATTLMDDADEADSEFEGYADVIASFAAAMVLSLPGTENINRYLIDRYFSTWEEGRARFKADRNKRNRQSSVRLTGGLR